MNEHLPDDLSPDEQADAKAELEMKAKEAEAYRKLCKVAIRDHGDYWRKRQPEMVKFRAMYASKFWEQGVKIDKILVQTGDGPSRIQGFYGSLHTRCPAVDVEMDPTQPGKDPAVAQAVVNAWLETQEAPFGSLLKMGLLYGPAFARVGPIVSTMMAPADPADAFELRALAPWDVLLDREAKDFRHMRWIGARYSQPFIVAKTSWPGVDFQPRLDQAFLEDEEGMPKKRWRNRNRRTEDEIPDAFKQIIVLELYDLVFGKLVFWSPDAKGTDGRLGAILSVEPMPLQAPGTAQLLHPFVPLYFDELPDDPLEGIALTSRFYDQVYEKNLMRTFLAGAVRRDARVFLVEKDAMESEQLAKLQRPVDGMVLPVNSPNKPLDKILVAIPNAPVSNNITQYGPMIDNDMDAGSPLASFSHGESSDTTATEVGVLAGYTASQLGSMAAIRDRVISAIATLYLAHLLIEGAPVVPEGALPPPPGAPPQLVEKPLTAVIVEGQQIAVVASMLDAKWTINADEQASTPAAKLIAKQTFNALVPMLQALGADPSAILRHLVKLNELPADLAVQVAPAQDAMGPGFQAQSPATPPAPVFAPSANQ